MEHSCPENLNKFTSPLLSSSEDSCIIFRASLEVTINNKYNGGTGIGSHIQSGCIKIYFGRCHWKWTKKGLHYAFFDGKHFDLPEQRAGVLVAPRSGAQFFAVALKGIQ